MTYKICVFKVDDLWKKITFKEMTSTDPNEDMYDYGKHRAIARDTIGHESIDASIKEAMAMIAKNPKKYSFSFYTERMDEETFNGDMIRHLPKADHTLTTM